MRLWQLVPAAVLALAVAGGAAAQNAKAASMLALMARKPIYAPSKDLDAMVAQTKNGLASAKLPTGSPSAVVMIAHRTADGEVEVHTKLVDEIIVRSGHARIHVGGRVTGQRQTGPDEFRGGTMSGGQMFDLAPGDAIFIPVGQPHQVLVPKGGQITYTAAKFPG